MQLPIDRNRYLTTTTLPKMIINYAEDERFFVIRRLVHVDSTFGLPENPNIVKTDWQELLYATSPIGKDTVFMYNAEQTRCIQELILDRDAWYGNEWDDRANIVFPIREVFEEPYNLYAYTAVSHTKTPKMLMVTRSGCIAQIYVVTKDQKVNETRKSFVFHPESTVITNIDLGIEETVEQVEAGSSKRFFPVFTLESSSTDIQADGTATVNVVAKDIYDNPWDLNTEMRVEVVSGYAPNSRVKIVNGMGSFRVRALDLVAGDEMRVKIGTRYFSGLAEIQFKVI